MISLNAINVGGLIDNLDLIWTIVFWAILGVLLFSFGLGMLRGWKAGTYRFIFLSILAVTLLALLGVFAEAAGQFNLANVTSNPITMTINGVTVSAQPGPLFETLKDLSFQILRDALHVKAPIETLQNYAIALAASTIRLALVAVIGLLVATLGALLCWILWHIAFKFIIPKPARKPRLRWISGIEEMVVSALCLVLIIVPFSGVANSLVANVDTTQISYENETVKMFKKVAESYDKSILNQVFFAWTKGDGNKTLDTQFAEFLAQAQVGEISANVVTEVSSFAIAAGGLIGAFANDTSQSGTVQGIAFTPINYAADLLTRVLVYSGEEGMDIVNGLAAFAADLAIHEDEVVSFLGEERITDLANFSKDASSYLNRASRSYRALAKADFLSTAVNPYFNETPYPAYEDAYALLTSDYTLAKLSEIQRNPSLAKVYDGLLKGYVYDHASHSNVKALAPKNARGELDAAKMNEMSYLSEAKTVVTFFHGLNELDADYTKTLTNASIRKASNSSESTLDFQSILFKTLAIMAKNGKAFSELIVGPRNAGEPEVNDYGNSAKGCLMDSGLLNAAFPILVELSGTLIGENVMKTEAIDLSAVSTSLLEGDWKNKIVNNKREFGYTLDILTNLVANPYEGNADDSKVAYGQTIADAGRDLLLDFKAHKGIDLDPEGALYDFDAKLGLALMADMSKVDKSMTMAALLPQVVDYYLSQTDFFGGADGLQLDFTPEDASGKSILGRQLGQILGIVASAPHVFPILLHSGGISVSSVATALSNHYDEFTKILDIISDSKILNPVIDGATNVNMARLFNMLFDKLDITVTLEELDLNGVDMTNEYDGDDGNIVSYLAGNRTTEHENFYLVDAVAGVMNSGVLDAMQQMVKTDEVMKSLSNADMEGIFTSIGGSVVLRKVLPPYFDEKLLDGMLNSSGDVDIQSLGISFRNLKTQEDWTEEGVRFQSMIDLVTKGIDLSDFDVFKEGTSLIDLMNTLSQSKMFMPLASSITDPEDKLIIDGEKATDPKLYYAFPDFFAQKLLSAVGNESQYMFEDEVPTGSTAMERCSAFVSACRDLNTPSKWAKNDTKTGEFDYLHSIFNDLGAIGSFDALTSIDATSIPKITSAMHHITDSYTFSTVLVANLLGHALDDMGEGGDINFKDANTAYFYDVDRGETYNRAEKTAQTQAQVTHLMNVISLVFDEQYGFAKNGKIDMSSLSFGSLSVEYFLRPFLEGAYESEVFHSTDPAFLAKHDATVFEQIIGSLTVNSSLYGFDTARFSWKSPLNALRNTSDKELGYPSSKSIYSIIKSMDHANWPNEIDAICNLVEFLQTSDFVDSEGNFSSAALDDIGAYFGDDPSIRASKADQLKTMLNGVNDIEVFRRALPRYLASAIDNGAFSGDLGKDLKCADFYYLTKVELDGSSDYAAYPSEEISHIINIFSDIATCSDMDVNNIKSIDGEALASAINEMEHSGCFNANTEKAATIFPASDAHIGHTCFVNLLADILNNDSLSSYFYYGSNPKDQEHKNAGDYQDSLTKAFYMVEKYCASNYAEKSSGKAQIDEFGSFIDFIGSDAFAPYIGASSTSFDKMNGEVLGNLLHALNDVTFYRDCVPSALDKTINEDNLYNIAGVDLSLANVYFSYSWVNQDGSLKSAASSTPDYEVPFYEPEIDQLSYIIGAIKDNKDKMSSFDISTFDAMTLRTLLRDMANSMVFHEAGAYKDSATYKDVWFKFDSSYNFVPSGKTLLRQNDLTVFEQLIQKIYIDSKLYQYNFSLTQSTEDLELYIEVAKGTSGIYGLGFGTSEDDRTEAASLIKLHDNIVAFSKGIHLDINGQTIAKKWNDEIDSLTTDGHPHTPRIDQTLPDDSYVGLIEVVQRLGISSGSVDIGTAELNTYQPSELYFLFQAINECSVINEILPDTFAKFISSKGSGGTKSFGLDKYSNDVATLVGPGVESYTYDVSLLGPVTKLELNYDGSSLDSDGVLLVTYNGEDVTELVDVTVSATSTTLDVSKIPGSFTISSKESGGHKFSNIVATYDTANYRLDQATYAKFAIRSLYYFFASTFRGKLVDNSYYYGFTASDELADFLDENPTSAPEKTNFEHSTFGLFYLITGSHLFERKFETAYGDYRSKDYFFYKLLTVEATIQYYPKLKVSFASDFGTFGDIGAYDSAIGLNALTEALKDADPDVELANEKAFSFEQAAYLDEYCGPLGFASALASTAYYDNFVGARPAGYEALSPDEFLYSVETATVLSDPTAYGHILNFANSNKNFAALNKRIYLFGTVEGTANPNFVTSSEVITEPGEMIKTMQYGIARKFACGYSYSVVQNPRTYSGRTTSFSPNIAGIDYPMSGDRSLYVDLDVYYPSLVLGSMDDVFASVGGKNFFDALYDNWKFIEAASQLIQSKADIADALEEFGGYAPSSSAETFLKASYMGIGYDRVCKYYDNNNVFFNFKNDCNVKDSVGDQAFSYAKAADIIRNHI